MVESDIPVSMPFQAKQTIPVPMPFKGRTKFEGQYPSDHGFVEYSDDTKILGSWNVLGPCSLRQDFYNNPQCAVETFETYKDRVLRKDGLLDMLLNKLKKEEVSVIALQETAFLSMIPPIQAPEGQSAAAFKLEWELFRLECENRITEAEFGILKSDDLAHSDEYNKELEESMKKSVDLDSFHSLTPNPKMRNEECFFVPNNKGIPNYKAPTRYYKI